MTEPARTRSTSARRPPARRASPPPAEKAPPTGVFRPHVRGFGFVDLDEPVTAPDGEPVTSCFVPPPLTKGLLADDRVTVTYAVDPDGRGTASGVTLRERVRTEVFFRTSQAMAYLAGAPLIRRTRSCSSNSKAAMPKHTRRSASASSCIVTSPPLNESRREAFTIPAIRSTNALRKEASPKHHPRRIPRLGEGLGKLRS